MTRYLDGPINEYYLSISSQVPYLYFESLLFNDSRELSSQCSVMTRVIKFLASHELLDDLVS